MNEILKKFDKKYGHLRKKGLIIDVLEGIGSGYMVGVINISRPFVFDNRLIPEKFAGIPIKKRIYGELPSEFKIKKANKNSQLKDYIWSPDRFERYVDRCAEEIQGELEIADMSRDEMLDALCFGNFEKHQQKCIKWVEDGVIPSYTEP